MTDGGQAQAYFANFAGAGISGAIAGRANRTTKALGGRLSFLFATVVGGILAAVVVATIVVWWFISLFVSRELAALLTTVIILVMAAVAVIDCAVPCMPVAAVETERRMPLTERSKSLARLSIAARRSAATRAKQGC